MSGLLLIPLIAFVIILIVVWILSNPSGAGSTVHGWITGIIVFVIAFIALALTEETFGKDLNYIEQ